MQRSALAASNLMRTLANEKRLMLLCHLIRGEMSVGALCEAVGLSQTNCSQQLALLRREGHVSTRRDGQTIHYSIAGDEVQRIVRVLYDLYCCRPGRRQAS